jgi:hypothetical protein
MFDPSKPEDSLRKLQQYNRQYFLRELDAKAEKFRAQSLRNICQETQVGGKDAFEKR